MIKVFFSSHGPLADGMIGSLQIIFGTCPNLKVFSAYMDERDLLQEIDRFYEEEVNPDDEVLLCSDVYGGSVNQVMFRCLGRKNTRLVTGVNLAFFLQLACAETLKDGALERRVEESRKYLCEVKDEVPEENGSDDFFSE